MLTDRDRQEIVNSIVRSTFKSGPQSADIPEKVMVVTSDGTTLEFERAHFTLRGYKGNIPGVGFLQILEQNPAKTGSWCGILASRYQLKVAWLWLNGNYHRCCIDLGGKDVLTFDATGGAHATRDEVRAHPEIAKIIEEFDGNREKQMEPITNLTHFN